MFFVILNCSKYTPQTSWLVNVCCVVKAVGQKIMNGLKSLVLQLCAKCLLCGPHGGYDNEQQTSLHPCGASDLVWETVIKKSYRCKQQ